MATAYDDWKANPTPDALAGVLRELEPTIISEAQRYPGPREVLRARARSLAIGAVRTYDPSRGASLRTWVSAGLQPLSRYGKRISVVRPPEVAYRRAAELNARERELREDLGRDPSDAELADYVGMAVDRVSNLRGRFGSVIAQSQVFTDDESGDAAFQAETVPPVTDTAAEMVYESMTPRDRSIYDAKTGRGGAKPEQNAAIAKRLGLSPAAVSQVSASLAKRIMEAGNAL